MKRLLQAAALIAAAVPAAADAAARIIVGQPGFYGVLEIGSQQRPRLLRGEPVLVRPRPVGALARPLYVHVPPGHVHRWEKFCRHYNACSRPVYFVTEEWYETVYVPAWREAQRRKGTLRNNSAGRQRGLES
jgi:hypothetical protein